ncbi:MAG TPA: XRE family transcriptional regulator [Anaerovoracaceae bacterium]|nr:XRE family transcriptional regulator [Anaerovoracaceae bacterium]
MGYILKQYDTDLMKFDIFNDFDGMTTKISWIDESKKHLLPLDLQENNDSLTKWIKGRTIPSNRAYVENFLAKLGLNEKDSKGIIDICKGLSLNDSYWIVDEHFSGSFEKHNLYHNPFSLTIALIAFTGYGSVNRTTFRSSPEFTTNGMLAKCWRRVGGKIMLYKSGTEGFANSGKEPYSEFYAYQIAEAMGLNAVKYNLSVWKGKLCSTCELFTDIDTSYIPIGRLVKEGGVRAVLKYLKELGDEYYQAVIDMFVFDAVICNTDRHFGNYGVLVDNKTNEIKGIALIFDNGLSLFHYAMDDDLRDIKAYAKTRTPSTYPDFVQFAKENMSKRQKDMLRKLLEFKFKKHPRYNLDDKRLKIIEKFINDRAKELLAE